MVRSSGVIGSCFFTCLVGRVLVGKQVTSNVCVFVRLFVCLLVFVCVCVCVYLFVWCLFGVCLVFLFVC